MICNEDRCKSAKCMMMIAIHVMITVLFVMITVESMIKDLMGVSRLQHLLFRGQSQFENWYR